MGPVAIANFTPTLLKDARVTGSCAMNLVYALVVGFVAASMMTVVYRFEPNRMLARALMAIVYLTGALAILAKMG